MSAPPTQDERERQLSEYMSRRASVIDIRVSNLHAELKNPARVPPQPFSLRSSIETPVFERGSKHVVFNVGYHFSSADSRGQPAWDISFTLSLYFSFREDDDAPIEDNALKAFGARSVLEIAHPYARELVHNMTARMRVPAIILEVLPPLYR